MIVSINLAAELQSSPRHERRRDLRVCMALNLLLFALKHVSFAQTAQQSRARNVSPYLPTISFCFEPFGGGGCGA